MLKTNEYHGHAYRKQVTLGEKTNLTEAHFSRWLNLFQKEAFKHLPVREAQLITGKTVKLALPIVTLLTKA